MANQPSGKGLGLLSAGIVSPDRKECNETCRFLETIGRFADPVIQEKG